MARSELSTLILDTLAQAGVRHLFGIPGDAMNGLVDAARRHDQIEFVTVRHEESGAFAASAQAKLTGEPGAVMGTAGPGAIHLLNGLYDAKLDGAPVIALTGQVQTPFIGSEYHQEVNLRKLFSDVAEFNETIVNPEQMPTIIESAVRSSLDTKSVSHVSIPADLALARVKDQANRSASTLVTPHAQSRPCEEDLQAAVRLLDQAQSPTLLVGIGASEAVQEVLELGSTLAAPIVKTLRAKELISDEHPLTVGGLGLLGSSAAVEAIERTDVLFMIGTDFPYEDFYPEGASAIQLDIERSHIGRRYPVQVGLVGNAKEALKVLVPRLQHTSGRAHLEKAQGKMNEWVEFLAKSETDDSVPIRPQRVAATIGDLTSPGTVFLCDTGTVTVWAARHLRLKKGDRFTLSANLASMGFALPAAIGAQLKHPERDVVALIGDGGFTMLLGELRTAVELELPITIVVFNNSKYGLIQMEQHAEGLPEHATGLSNPDLAEVARALGAEGWRIEHPDDLYPSLTAALTNGRVSVVDVVVDPDEMTMPPRIELDQVTGYIRGKLKEILP